MCCQSRFAIIFICQFQIISYCLLSQDTGSIYDTAHINQLNSESFHLLKTNPDSARLLASQAIQLSEKTDYLAGLGDGYTRLAIIEKDRGNFPEALIHYKASHDYRKQQGDTYPIGKSLNNLCIIYEKIGELDSSIYYGLEGLRIAESLNDSELIANCSNNLAIAYEEYEEYKNAKIYYHKALDITTALKDTLGITRGFANLGNLNLTLKHYVESISDLRTAIDLFGNRNPQPNYAKWLNNLGLAYQGIKEYDSALYYFMYASELDSINGWDSQLAIVLSNMGVLNIELLKYKEAVLYLNRSLVFSLSSGDKQLNATNYFNLALALHALGEYAGAFHNISQYIVFKDSVFNEDKAESISKWQTKYETEKKEQQITLLNQQNKTRSLQRNILFGGSIALLLALAALTFIYVQRQRLARQQEQISQQKIDELLKTQEIKTYNAMIEGQEDERKRIAIDLHDRLGSMLATVKMHFSSLEERLDKHQLQIDNQYGKAHLLLDQAVDEVRRISHNLSTGMVVSFGLEAALHELCESIESTGKIKTKLLVYGLSGRLDNQIEITIYRIIQEVISNILKHAQATLLTIQINKSDDTLNVTVEDDGIGFNVEEKMKTSGIGLKNMIARAEKLNAQFHIDSSPGNGSIAVLEIPLLPEGPHPID